MSVKIKNHELIRNLFKSLILENNGELTLSDVESYLDQIINGKDGGFMSFEDRVLHWRIDDRFLEEHKNTFHKKLEMLCKMGEDVATLVFKVKCPTCIHDLQKIEMTDTKYIYRCGACKVTHEFEMKMKCEVDSGEDTDSSTL